MRSDGTVPVVCSAPVSAQSIERGKEVISSVKMPSNTGDPSETLSPLFSGDRTIPRQHQLPGLNSTPPNNNKSSQPVLSLLEAIFLPLIEQVRLCASEIHDLWTSISILLHLDAFPTVIRVRHPDSAAYDAPSLETPVVAFVAYVDQIAGPDERIADDTLPVALLAQPPDGNTGLLSAHNQVRMMLGHLESII